ncbi:MAG: FecR family protein, partial [Spirochaetes bacterium]|nr:FecR family protein [Spirochaetota bacterium]
ATQGESNTNIGLKYGAINAKVKKIATVRTQFKISTPIATSSVRGTEEEVSYGPQWGMIVKVLEGAVDLNNDTGISNTIKGNLVFQLKTDQPRPEFLLSERMDNTLVKLFLDSMTEEEKKLLEQFGFDTGPSPEKIETPLDREKAKATIKLVWQ